jgi:TPR repeat protein
VKIGKKLWRSKGRGSTPENVKAYECFYKASIKYHPEGTWMLYNCIRYSDGTNFDAKGAEIILFNAANQGNAEAQYRYSLFQLSGESKYPDIEEALLWAKRSSEQGLIKGSELLGSIYFRYSGLTDSVMSIVSDVDNSVSSNENDYIKNQCEKGDINAMYAFFMIILCKRWRGVYNYNEGLKWAIEATNKGHELTAVKLLTLHHWDSDVGSDELKKRIYDILLSKNDNTSLTTLGVALIHNKHFIKNTELGVKLLKKAYKRGCGEAARQLGYLYQNGIVFKRDGKKSQYYLWEAANMGCVYAQRDLIRRTDTKYECIAKKALNLLSETAFKGGKYAKYQMGNFSLGFLRHTDPPYMSIDEAISYLEEASEMGCANASTDLAYLYSKGHYRYQKDKIVDKNTLLSDYYNKKGAEQGSDSCQVNHANILFTQERFKEAYMWSHIALNHLCDNEVLAEWLKELNQKIKNRITEKEMQEAVEDSYILMNGMDVYND